MSFKIGFTVEGNKEEKLEEAKETLAYAEVKPRKSIVQVYFEERNMKLAYYNDQFDLKCGDLVYVEGKLEGIRGRVVDVLYNFKIKLSAYKRVIAVVDTNVKGQFFMAGSHFVTFGRETLPKKQVIAWYKAPTEDEEEYITGDSDESFKLDNLQDMKISPVIAERGHDYYMDNKVRYICVDGTKGYAIVEGTEPYDVEFEYLNGEIRGLSCSCYCGFNCKHEFAAMLQLNETLEHINQYYFENYKQSRYFAAINKGTLFAFAIDGKENGSFIL